MNIMRACMVFHICVFFLLVGYAVATKQNKTNACVCV